MWTKCEAASRMELTDAMILCSPKCKTVKEQPDSSPSEDDQNQPKDWTIITVPPQFRDADEMVVLPRSGVIQNICCTRDGNIGVNRILKSFKIFNPENGHVFGSKGGRVGVAILQFKRDLDGYNDAQAFKKYFVKRNHSLKHWLRYNKDENELGCELYGWLANEEDFFGRRQNGNEALCKYLQATAELSFATQEMRDMQSRAIAKAVTGKEEEIRNLTKMLSHSHRVRNQRTKMLTVMAEEIAATEEQTNHGDLDAEKQKLKDVDSGMFLPVSHGNAIFDPAVERTTPEQDTLWELHQELAVERKKVKELENRVLDLTAQKAATKKTVDLMAEKIEASKARKRTLRQEMKAITNLLGEGLEDKDVALVKILRKKIKDLEDKVVALAADKRTIEENFDRQSCHYDQFVEISSAAELQERTEIGYSQFGSGKVHDCRNLKKDLEVHILEKRERHVQVLAHMNDCVSYQQVKAGKEPDLVNTSNDIEAGLHTEHSESSDTMDREEEKSVKQTTLGSVKGMYKSKRLMAQEENSWNQLPSGSVQPKFAAIGEDQLRAWNRRRRQSLPRTKSIAISDYVLTDEHEDLLGTPSELSGASKRTRGVKTTTKSPNRVNVQTRSQAIKDKMSFSWVQELGDTHDS